MKCNECEAVFYLHRHFRPRRRTGRGFLVGVTFLDAALLIVAFVLLTSPFVLKPGIRIRLPEAGAVEGVRFNHMVLSVSGEGILFFNDELLTLDEIENAFRAAREKRTDIELIIEADAVIPQEMIITIYDRARRAGIQSIFIATQPPTP